MKAPCQCKQNGRAAWLFARTHQRRRALCTWEKGFTNVGTHSSCHLQTLARLPLLSVRMLFCRHLAAPLVATFL